MKSKSVVILSGGMDSTTLLYELFHESKEELYTISFHYGQKHSKELACAMTTTLKLDLPHQVISLPLGDVFESSSLVGTSDVPDGHYEDAVMKKTVVPNRNMIMISIAAAYAMNIGAKKVYYGAHAGDHAIYPDCRREFVEALAHAVKLGGYEEIELCAPYLLIDKSDICARGKELKVPYQDTWTCYKGQDKPCGTCGSCVERAEAFEFAEIEDPLL